jgi:hypothetical protein
MPKWSKGLSREFLCLPSKNPPQYLFSLKNKRVFNAGLSFYNESSIRASIKKNVLRNGYAFFKSLPEAFGRGEEEVNLSVLLEFLQSRDFSAVNCNVYIPSYDKAVVQVTDDSGICKKIIKIALSNLGRKSIEIEVKNLRFLSSFFFHHFEIPRVINEAFYEGLYYCENTSPERYRPLKWHKSSDILIQGLCELFRMDFSASARIIETPLFMELQEKVTRIPSKGSLEKLSKRTLDIYLNPAFDYSIPLGLVHNDFKPWNLLVNLDTHRPVLVDWKLMVRNGLPLWDVYCYVLFTYFSLCYDVSPARALKSFENHRGFIELYTHNMGIDKRLINYLVPLYLLDLLLKESLWEKWEKGESRPVKVRRSILSFLEYLLNNR